MYSKEFLITVYWIDSFDLRCSFVYIALFGNAARDPAICTKAGFSISIVFLTNIYLIPSYRPPASKLPQAVCSQCLIWVILALRVKPVSLSCCAIVVKNNKHILALWLYGTSFTELLAIKIWAFPLLSCFNSPWVCNQHTCSTRRISAAPK